jgi:hypothetical protein
VRHPTLADVATTESRNVGQSRDYLTGWTVSGLGINFSQILTFVSLHSIPTVGPTQPTIHQTSVSFPFWRTDGAVTAVCQFLPLQRFRLRAGVPSFYTGLKGALFG